MHINSLTLTSRYANKGKKHRLDRIVNYEKVKGLLPHDLLLHFQLLETTKKKLRLVAFSRRVRLPPTSLSVPSLPVLLLSSPAAPGVSNPYRFALTASPR